MLVALSLWDMYQIHAHQLLKLFDDLRSFEMEILTPRSNITPERISDLSQKIGIQLAAMVDICDRLELSSATKQLRYILEHARENTSIGGQDLGQMMGELRRRIREDLEEHVYMCIPRSGAADYFKLDALGEYKRKVASELMDATIVARFPAASDDIESAFQCLVCDCYPASVFHLMRIVELGVLEVARLSGLADPKPSWGAILKYVEKLVLRMKFEDLDPAIQPHRLLLEQLLPQMQAIQRAWRNKISHVEGKLIPVDGSITEPIARELFVAVEAFMRQLAADLPAADR